jgi:hypothetical protein
MGVHEQDYAERWIVDLLAPAPGLVVEPGSRTTVLILLAGIASQPVPPPQLTVHRYRKPGATGGREVAFTFNAIT